MRLRILILLATLSVALALSCDQRPADPVLPTIDVHWTPVLQLTREAPISWLWASGPDNIYAGQSLGGTRLLRYDGTAWSPVPLNIDNEYGRPVIWGSSANDVYVASERLHHFDGNSWSVELVDAQWVSGVSQNKVFAASYTKVFEFNGATWDTLGTISGSYGMDAAPDGSLFVSEYDSVSIWDGAVWTKTSIPGSCPSALLAFAKDSALVVQRCPFQVLRWDGASWTPQLSPSFAISGLAGTSETDVYAAGREGHVIHFDGVSWDELPSIGNYDLNAVALSGPNVVVAGEAMKIASWNGTDWTVLHQPVPRRVTTGVFAESTTHLMMDDGSTVFERSNGLWTERPIPNAYANAFGGSSLSDLFAGTARGIFHFDGTSWSLVDSVAVDQWALWRSPNGSMYTVGLHSGYRLGSTWERIYDGDDEFYVATGDGSDGLVAGGKRGTGRGEPVVAHFDGVKWRELPPPEDDVYGLWSGPEMDLYFAGGQGLYRWNGQKFRRVSPPQHGFSGVFGLDDGRILAIGPEEVAILQDGLINLIPSDGQHGFFIRATDGTVLLLEEDAISSWRP
jgi:hypothetical protein